MTRLALTVLFVVVLKTRFRLCHAWLQHHYSGVPRIRSYNLKDSVRRLQLSKKQKSNLTKFESVRRRRESLTKPKQASRSNNKQPQQQSSDSFIRSTTFQTALVIVPPDRAWDSLQRARHFAQDSTYSQWPPCIRLFHPFCLPERVSDVAMDLALIVEEANLEPFDITLSQWTILPHAELLQAEALAQEQLPEMAEMDSSQTSHESDEEARQRQEIQNLIRTEEELGRRRKRLREIKQQNKRRLAAGEKFMEDSCEPSAESPSPSTQHSRSESIGSMNNSSTDFEEYNGPCVICLEPDAESQQKLQQLRDFLRPLLFDGPDYYSPTSSVSKTSLVSGKHGDSAAHEVYRPVVTIGTFDSVSSAIPIARKLRGLLGAPLTFSVTDLQFISCQDTSTTSHESSWLPRDEIALSDVDQFGCDAMVMLVGEELEPIDEEVGQEVAALLLEKGVKGGQPDQSEDTNPYPNLGFSDDSYEKDDDSQSTARTLEEWLFEDDEYDEGSVVVIGRTHFFTGENRMYVGMPAASSKDRKKGDGNSGETRRKNAPIMSQRLWSEISYGSVEETTITRAKRYETPFNQIDQDDAGWEIDDD